MSFVMCHLSHVTKPPVTQSFRWAPTIWKDSGFGIFQEMIQKAGRNSASCQLAFCKKLFTTDLSQYVKESGQLLVRGPLASLRVAPRGCSQRSCQSEAPLDSDFWQNFSVFLVIFQWVLPNFRRILAYKIFSGSSAADGSIL